MKLAYALIIILIGVLLTPLMSRKNLALPFALCLPFLPSYINFPVGSVNIWSSDLLSVLVLSLILLFSLSKTPNRLLAMDLLLPLACLWRGIGLAISGEDMNTAIQGSIRWMLPWVLPYFIGRFGIGSWEGFKRTLKAMFVIGMLVGGFGAFEAFTGRNILAVLGIGWNPTDIKFGLWRSKSTYTSMHILGMHLAVLCVLSLSLYFAHQRKRRLYLIVAVILGFGTFVSTSSTGVMQGLGGLGFMLLYRYRQYWKVWTYGFLFLNVVGHFLSRDGIHYVYARRLTGMGEAYYRAVLIDTVLEQMPGYWLFGRGNNEVHLWFVSYEDICNQWLYFLVKAGLPGFLCLAAFYVLMLLRLRETYTLLSGFRGERVFLWGILSTLVAVVVSWFFIALFGSDISLFAFYFGMIVSTPDLARAALNNRQPADTG